MEWIRALAFDVLDLRGVTLVGQDWGGLIGLRLVAEHPTGSPGIVAANTGLPTGDSTDARDLAAVRERGADRAATLDVGRFVQSGCRTRLRRDVRAGYDAPFPDEAYKAGPRAMPGLVPDRAGRSGQRGQPGGVGRHWGLADPVLVAFSDSDPITGAMAPILQRRSPGARGREHPVIAGAGHFLQEDAGPGARPPHRRVRHRHELRRCRFCPSTPESLSRSVKGSADAIRIDHNGRGEAVMFVQVITGKTSKAAEVRAAVDRWRRTSPPARRAGLVPQRG